MTLKDKQYIAFYKKQEMYLRGCNERILEMIKGLQFDGLDGAIKNEALIVECNELIIDNNREIKSLLQTVHHMSSSEA